MSSETGNVAESTRETEDQCLQLISDIRNEVQLLLLNGHLTEEQKGEILKDVIGILGGFN